MQRVRMVMLETVDCLHRGEQVNLPPEIAEQLAQRRQAEYVRKPSETKPTGPTENKVVVPENKKFKAKK